MAEEARISLLGELTVTVGDRRIAESAWPTRRARELVALLALAASRRLPRDAVVERLWPHLPADAGAANLRKAAHHARRTLGAADAVVLHGGQVALLPGRRVAVDLTAFLSAADEALRAGDPAACAAAADLAGDGALLPSLAYEAWVQEPRRRVEARLAALLRVAGDAERLLTLEPTDERAARQLMQAELDAGRRHAALRIYEQVRLALAREAGTTPAAATRAIYDRCTAGIRLGEPAFVGRATELAAASRALRAAADEHGTTAIVVRGPTGIGTSALGRELADRAATRGWLTLAVSATADGPPLAPLGAAVEQLLAGGHVALDALPHHTRTTLAAVSPAAGTRSPASRPLTRHQLIAALRRVLASDPEPAPVLLCVEDAHLTDEATADVLHQLVTGGTGGRALAIVLVMRGEWIRTSLPRGVAELLRAPPTLRLELGPLPDADILELVRLTVGDAATAQQIARAADGSPFYALELARVHASGQPGAHQASLRAAIAERLSPLDPGTLDALVALAVAELALDLDAVLALTGLPEDAAFRLLDAALEAGMLVVAGTRYRFRHELVRRALLDDLPPHRRVAVHRAAARRLADSGAPAGRVAHHLLAGGRPQQAVPHLLDAARAAIGVGAFADARATLERLLAHAPDHLEALVLHAETLDALGDSGAPAAYAAAATAAGPPDDQDLVARRAQAQLKASHVVEAVQTLEGVTPHSTAGRLAQALTLSAAAAVGAYADREAAGRLAEEAHRLALELGDPGAILDATWASALAAHAQGRLPARLREYLRQTSALPEIATRVFDGQLCVTERMLHGGLPNDEIIAFADGLAAEARRLGAARGQAFARTLRGEAGLLAGRLEDADRDFAEGARLHGQIGALAGEALSLLGRAQVAIARRRGAYARPFLADALLMARESEVGHHTLDRIYGAMVEAASDPEDGIALVGEAETAVQGPAETCPTCRIAFTVPATIAAARAGDLPRAHRYRDDVRLAIAHIALPPAWHAAAEEAHGWVATAEGRGDEARAHFAAAAAGFLQWGQPLDGERCRTLAATP